MAKAKAKVNEKTLDVLTKTKKPSRRGPKKAEGSPKPKPPPSRSRSRSRSRTPSRVAKVEKIVPKSEPKKSAGKKPKAVNNSVVKPKSEPIVKRLDGEVKKTRGVKKTAIPKNSTPKKKPQEIATPTRKQPRRIAAINSGNSHTSHKMEVDYVDSPVSVGFKDDEVEEVNSGGGGWFSRCCIV